MTDSNILAAIIVGGCTIVGAIVGAFLAKYPFMTRVFRASGMWSLIGEWDGLWVDLDDKKKREYRERLVITKQRKSRVYGYIQVQGEVDKKWNCEGRYTGRFLQLYYYPSDDAKSKFLDYGCYFFEIQGDGTFKGYSVGFDWGSNRTGLSRHKLVRR